MSGHRFGLLCVFMLSLAMGAGIAIILLAEPLPDRPLRLLLVSSDDSQQTFIAGAQAAARERGAELIVRKLSSTEPRRVTESVASVLADGVDGVIVSGDANGDVARQLRKLGVENIVAAGRAADGTDLMGQIATAEASGGRVCASVIQEALPDGGRVVVLVDDARTSVGAERLQGLLEGISFANRFGKRWEIVERLEDHGNPGDRAENVRSALRSNPGIDFVIDLGDRTGQGGAALLANFAARHGAQLITFDGSEQSLAGVESGEVYAVIGENRFLQGSESVNFLARMIRESPMGLPVPGRGGVNVPAQVLRRGNLAGYRTPEFVSLTPAA